MQWQTFVASWWVLALQACIPWVSGGLPLVRGRGGKMQWKAHKLNLLTPWSVPWSFTRSWGYLRWAWSYSLCLQAIWGMRLRCTCGVHWWTLFRPHPAALLPEVSAPSGRCVRLGLAILRCTSSFWWSWGECQLVGRGERHSNWCCAPVLWWSGIEYSQRHVFQIGSTCTVAVRLCLLHSSHIAWDEDQFTPGTWRRCLPQWVL